MDTVLVDGRSWYRRTGSWCVDGRGEYLVKLAHRDDDSPRQVGGYDARCSSCWLGYGHTVEVHTRAVER